MKNILLHAYCLCDYCLHVIVERIMYATDGYILTVYVFTAWDELPQILP